jgi:hypothetical protein
MPNPTGSRWLMRMVTVAVRPTVDDDATVPRMVNPLPQGRARDRSLTQTKASRPWVVAIPSWIGNLNVC